MYNNNGHTIGNTKWKVTCATNNIHNLSKVISPLLSKTITYVIITEKKLLIKIATKKIRKKSCPSLRNIIENGNFNATYAHNPIIKV